MTKYATERKRNIRVVWKIVYRNNSVHLEVDFESARKRKKVGSDILGKSKRPWWDPSLGWISMEA